MVQQLDMAAMRRLVASIITHHPGIVFDALDAMQVGAPTPPPPTAATSNHPKWCVCGRCREKPTDIERLCCGLQHCISERPVGT